MHNAMQTLIPLILSTIELVFPLLNLQSKNKVTMNHFVFFLVPRTEIPEWFDHRNEGIPIFMARGKFPVVAVAFAFEEVNAMGSIPSHWQTVRLQLFIEGEHVHCKQRVLSLFPTIMCCYANYELCSGMRSGRAFMHAFPMIGRQCRLAVIQA